MWYNKKYNKNCEVQQDFISAKVAIIENYIHWSRTYLYLFKREKWMKEKEHWEGEAENLKSM